MKLRFLPTPLSSHASSFHRKFLKQLLHSAPTRSRHPRNGPNPDSLYRRLSPLGDPNASVLPVLDRWIREGKSASKGEVQRIINELMSYKRHKHALEVSLWMTDGRRFRVVPFDVAIRLKLILKVFGLEKAENYFNKIPEHLKTHSTYLALLNCYTITKSVDKAESIMQKVRGLGYATVPIWYNLMMNMYYQLGNREKFRGLLAEMEAKGISHDSFTLSICLNACAVAADAEGMDSIIRIMESNALVNVHWKTYVIAAEGCLKMGSIDKAMKMLYKLERQLTTEKNNEIMFVFLLKLYAQVGKRDELYRIWNLYKQNCKVLNKVYISMIRALMKFNDIEGAEKIFEEWESSGLPFDFRVPNLFVDAYCTSDHLEKAEGLITRGISKGGDPLLTTWCHMAGGYLKRNQVSEAIEALKKAVLVCPPQFTSQKDNLTTCLEYLDHRDSVEKAEELINFLRMGKIAKKDASDNLCDSVDDDELQLCGIDRCSDGIFVGESK